jgi:hypothetical protein
VQAARIDEHCGLAVAEIAHGASPEREVGVALERHHRREVQAALEPRLHLVQAAALDVQPVLAGEHAQVIVHRLGHHARLLTHRAGRALVVERRRHHQHHGGGQGRHQRRSPPAPPRERGGGRRPPGGQPPLERQRRRVLGQTELEHRGQLVLERVQPGTGSAALQVGPNLVPRGRGQAIALIVQEPEPDVLAAHRA